MNRRLAREIAVQGLYQMEMNDVTAAEAVAMIAEEAANEDSELEAKQDGGLAEVSERALELTEGVDGLRAAIDDMLQHYLTGWQMDRLSRVDRQILRLAAFELIYRDDVPPKAAVNEAIELAKHFGTEESGKFVNGVLGRVLAELDALKQDRRL